MVTPVLPVQGDHVALVLADDSEIAVQIDGVAADGRLNVTVTRVGAQTAPGVDDEFILRWANDRGRHCAWVRLVSFSSVVQWDLELISGIQSLQERQYVRCGSSESASLTRTIVEGVTYHGEVADLSERSVRLRLRVEGFANTVSAAGDPAAENSPDEDLPDEDLPDEGSPDESPTGRQTCCGSMFLLRFAGQGRNATGVDTPSRCRLRIVMLAGIAFANLAAVHGRWNGRWNACVADHVPPRP